MADGKTFQAKIELMGKLHASLSGAVKMAQSKLRGLTNAAKRMGAGISAGFAKVGAAVTSFAGQLIGLTLAFAGLRSASEFIAKSKEQFRGNEQAAAELNATLANNPKIAKLGAKELERQQKGFSDWADRMQESSVYASSIWRNVGTGLAQWGAGVKDAEKLSGFINDILAGRHGLKATGESAKSLGDALGKMVATGKLGKFGKEFGLTKDDEKRFAKMRSAAERIDYIQQRAAKYRGRAAALGATEAGQIQQAENRIADFQSRMGEGFVRLEGKWIKFVDRMLPYIEPVILKMTELFEGALGAVIDFVDEFMVHEEVQKAWKELSEAASEIWNAISGILGLGDVNFSQWVKEETVQLMKDLAFALDAIRKAIEFLQGKREIDLGIKMPEWAPAPMKAAVSQAETQAAAGTLKGMRRTERNEPLATHFRGMPREVEKVQEKVASVEAAAEQTADAFKTWEVSGAVKNSLDAVLQSVNSIKAAAAGGLGLENLAVPAKTHHRGMPMQHGGIVTRPTSALIGEAGPEAVVPLTGGPLGAAYNLGQAMQALWKGAGSKFNVNYAPNFSVYGAGGPGQDIVKQIESMVRAGHDELLKQIEAIDSELLRRAFI